MRTFRVAQAPGSTDPGPAGTAARVPAVPGPAGGPRSKVFRGPLVLLSASVLLAAAGTVLLVLTARAGGGSATANQALTDAAATRQVTAAVSAGVTKIYTYSYSDLAATQRAAGQVLTGRAAVQYRQLFPALRAAAAQRLTVTTRVSRIGVISLTSDSARLLVFLDQTVTRGGKPGGSVAAQLEVTAELSGGRWLITGIDAR